MLARPAQSESPERMEPATMCPVQIVEAEKIVFVGAKLVSTNLDEEAALIAEEQKKQIDGMLLEMVRMREHFTHMEKALQAAESELEAKKAAEREAKRQQLFKKKICKSQVVDDMVVLLLFCILANGITHNTLSSYLQ